MTDDRHSITLHMLERGGRAQAAREDLARALGRDAVTVSDEAGMVDVDVRAASRDEALRVVRDAIAAVGADEVFTFPETTGTAHHPPGERAPR